MANLYTQYLIGKSMKIVTNQISTVISKGKLSEILAEAMKDETAGAAIKRVLNPFLAESFPQHPTFTQISLGATAEDGSTVVSLKVPAVKKVVVDVTEDQVEDEIIVTDPTEVDPETTEE